MNIYTVGVPNLKIIDPREVFKPGVRRSAPGFLKLLQSVCKCLYACVCLLPRLLITSGVMWYDIDPI